MGRKINNKKPTLSKVGETNVGILTGDESADSASTEVVSTDSTSSNIQENHEVCLQPVKVLFFETAK